MPWIAESFPKSAWELNFLNWQQIKLVKQLRSFKGEKLGLSGGILFEFFWLIFSEHLFVTVGVMGLLQFSSLHSFI